MKTLQGLGTALITPFKVDESVDFDALRVLLDEQIAGGVDFLVVLGTTAEVATMTRSEKDAVIQCVVSHVSSRVPLVLGVGGNNTAQVLDDLNHWHEVLTQHFAAILSVCPYYNKPTQEGLYRHFTTIAQACPIPVILYNVPGRTGVNMQPETAVRILEQCPDRIMGVKEASGDIDQIDRLIEMAHHRMQIFSGDDAIACEVMNIGADGLISVASNAWPEAFGRIVHQHDMAMQQRYGHLVHLLFVEGNPSGIKTVLSLKGLIQNVLRLPLVPNSPQVQTIIRQAMEAV